MESALNRKIVEPANPNGVYDCQAPASNQPKETALCADQPIRRAGRWNVFWVASWRAQARGWQACTGGPARSAADARAKPRSDWVAAGPDPAERGGRPHGRKMPGDGTGFPPVLQRRRPCFCRRRPAASAQLTASFFAPDIAKTGKNASISPVKLFKRPKTI